ACLSLCPNLRASITASCLKRGVAETGFSKVVPVVKDDRSIAKWVHDAIPKHRGVPAADCAREPQFLITSDPLDAVERLGITKEGSIRPRLHTYRIEHLVQV